MNIKIKRPKSKQPLPKSAKKVFDGQIFDVYQWKQKMFDGSFSTFEKIVRQDTVMVIPVTQKGKIVLIEEKQPGKKPFLAVAGGRIEKGEAVLEAAERELLEETGLKASEFFLFDAVQPVSKIEWAVYTLIARRCKKIKNLTLDSGEKINPIEVTFDEFMKIIVSKKFQDSEITWRMQRSGILKFSHNKSKMQEIKNLLLG
ncbi:NUDIX domain-containing protein [Patescibacteria group bacterium]